VAVTQENVLQQPDQNNLVQTPEAQAPKGPTAGGQAQSADLNFSQLLEQQIAQAIQPVLDEFRQQMAQMVAQQTAGAPVVDSSAQAVRQEAPQGHGAEAPAQQPPTQSQPVQPSGPPAAAQQPPGPATQQAPVFQPVSQLQQAASAVLPSQLGAQPSAQAEQRPLAGALAPALQAVERRGEQWLQSLLVAGLSALLTESTRAAIQQRAEQGLHTLLQKLFEAAPDGVTNQEMQRKIEGTLQLILRESLDAVFAEAMRTAVQQGSQQAIRQSLHGDFRSALTKVEDTLRVMADALLAVLRRHQRTVIRLLLALALLALESSLLQPDQAKK
jgi:hypothetical protein